MVVEAEAAADRAEHAAAESAALAAAHKDAAEAQAGVATRVAPPFVEKLTVMVSDAKQRGGRWLTDNIHNMLSVLQTWWREAKAFFSKLFR